MSFEIAERPPEPEGLTGADKTQLVADICDGLILAACRFSTNPKLRELAEQLANPTMNYQYGRLVAEKLVADVKAKGEDD